MNTTGIDLRKAITFFKELETNKEINSREYRIALKRLAQSGRQTYILRAGVKYIFSAESIDCDCGKGIYCPTIQQRKAKRDDQ